MTSETLYNHFELKHIDDKTTVTCSFQAMFTSEVIDNFISFLRGCGHYEKGIYEHMSSISEEYFEMEEKRNLELLKKFNVPKPDLDGDLE